MQVYVAHLNIILYNYLTPKSMKLYSPTFLKVDNFSMHIKNENNENTL